MLGSAFHELWTVLYWRIGLEAIVWIAAFVYFAIHNPYVQAGFTICPLENLGFHYCPGCGLGRAVSFLLHGDITRSIHTHILGIPATIILLSRTFSLLNKSLKGKVLQYSFH
ncbi:MAG: DUF2752 domain-containing protein [Bacteroidetes bacterium]|nr:DUF2752 domain-containing protein [Bacteroidota bacterium]